MNNQTAELKPAFDSYIVLGQRGGWRYIVKQFPSYEEAASCASQLTKLNKRRSRFAVYRFVEIPK